LVFGKNGKITQSLNPNTDEFLTKNQKPQLFNEKPKTKN